jgi:hypothetical protein
MKKIVTIILFILTISLIITACSKAEDEEEPKVNFTFNISNLTDDEFKDVGTKTVENTTKDDFKSIQFTLEVEHSNKIKNREIIVPSIKEIVISKYKDRYWFGEGSTQDNKEENFAKYNEKIVFYSKGLDEKDIKDIFKSAEIKISWITSNGESKEKIINLEEGRKIIADNLMNY